MELGPWQVILLGSLHRRKSFFKEIPGIALCFLTSLPIRRHGLMVCSTPDGCVPWCLFSAWVCWHLWFLSVEVGVSVPAYPTNLPYITEPPYPPESLPCLTEGPHPLQRLPHTIQRPSIPYKASKGQDSWRRRHRFMTQEEFCWSLQGSNRKCSDMAGVEWGFAGSHKHT